LFTVHNVQQSRILTRHVASREIRVLSETMCTIFIYISIYISWECITSITEPAMWELTLSEVIQDMRSMGNKKM